MGDKNVDYSVLERILAGSEEPRHLALEILRNITDNFSADRKIGRGGFSDVYKGDLHHWIVAVKKIKEDFHTLDDKLFLREVQSLLKIIEHPNVVRFLGFHSNAHHEANERRVVEIRERLLCFEYISNGSLENYITDELRGLEWNVRYKIIKGICEGLRYLHIEMNIVHMDLKSANIMVDTDMLPKITDFGLARLAENKNTTGQRFFSQGYCAPEYLTAGMTTFECDIYSLGVIIKEIVTEQKEIPNKDNVIRRWRCRWRKSGTYTPVQVQQITKCMEIAERCTQKQPEKRPSISEIIRYLDQFANADVNISAVNQTPYLETDDMLGIEPLELRFAFELNKETVSNEVNLTNETDNCIAFKIKTFSLLRYLYCTRPNKGIVRPKSMVTVKITLRTQEVTKGQSMGNDDEFIVRSTKVPDGLSHENITEDMLSEEAGKVVDEVKLMVVYDYQSMKPLVDQSSSLEPNAPVVEETNSWEPSAKRQRLTFGPQLQLVPTTNVDSLDRLPVTVSVMTGAMGRLLPKLLELLKQEHNLQRSLKKCFEALERQLKRMHAGLYKVSQEQQDQPDEEVNVWANQVRELSYDTEDIVDDLIVCNERSEPITDQDGIKEKVEDILERVKEAADWYATYKLRHPVSALATSSSKDPRQRALYQDHRQLVGINGPRDELIKRLTDWPDDASCKQQLKIISIWGEGGLGKTTLVKQVYDMLAVRFHLKAFVTLGRKPDIERKLKDILIKIDKDTSGNIHSQSLEEFELIEMIQNVLKNKRYLIIIDDIWDTESWETIKRIFIDNNNGSRVMTTSRNSAVAKISGDVCELKPLTHDQSMQLFYSRLTYKSTSTFDQQNQQSTEYILEKCGGLPLAIITIASLLDGKRVEDWPKVYNSIKFGHDDKKAENTKKILLLSYYDLPSHLKTCSLYLSIYPEDHVIEKNKLVWKWILEGFVRQEKGKTLFEVGEGYFNELINRCIIQPVEPYIDPIFPEELLETGTIRACRVHDMVLDFICSMAKEENFVTVLDNDEQHLSSQNNARILAVHKGSLEQDELGILLDKTCKKQAMRSFNASTGCDLNRMGLESLLPRFQGLRVLSLENCEAKFQADAYPLKIVAQLRHLRYLSLAGTEIRKLPMEIGGLKCLQILDLTETEIDVLPQSVTQLRGLKSLLCYSFWRSVKLPDGMGSLTSLEELRMHIEPDMSLVDSEDDMSDEDYIPTQESLKELDDLFQEMGNLTELRVLQIEIRGFTGRLKKALVLSLNKLKKLEELCIFDPLTHTDEWDYYSPGKVPLRHLRLTSIKMPLWIGASLRNIFYLELQLSTLNPWDLGQLGSIPELGYLILHIKRAEAFHGTVIAVAANAFPKLRHFDTNCCLTYVQEAMQCLQSLRLLLMVQPHVKFVFDSIQCLHSLENVRAKIFPKVRSMRTMAELRSEVDNHPNYPILVLE